MNLDNYGQEHLDHKITHLLTNVLSGIAFLIFIAFMFALLASPFWLPTIVEKITIH